MFDENLYGTKSSFDEKLEQTFISQQKFHERVEEMKKTYDTLLLYLEYDNNDIKKLIDSINMQCKESQEELKLFLHLLIHISNNHYRDEFLFKKIFQILDYFKDKIKQSFSNSQIFDIFRTNEIIILFLIEKSILTFDQDFYHSIKFKSESIKKRFLYFFIQK